MTIGKMHDRFTADCTALVYAIECVNQFDDFTVRVVLPANIYFSPTGESIDLPEICATVYGNTCELKVEIVSRYIQILNDFNLDVLHVKMLMQSFAVGELQYNESYNDNYAIDCEIDDTVMLLHKSRLIDASLIDA